MPTPENFPFGKEGKPGYNEAIDDNPSDAKAVKRQYRILAITEMTAGIEVSLKQARSAGFAIKRI